MKKEVFVIWDKKEGRITLFPINYGVAAVYLTCEQAAADLSSLPNDNHEVRQMILSDN